MRRIVFNIASFIFSVFLLTSTALAIPSADYSLSEVWDGTFWNYNLDALAKREGLINSLNH